MLASCLRLRAQPFELEDAPMAQDGHQHLVVEDAQVEHAGSGQLHRLAQVARDAGAGHVEVLDLERDRDDGFGWAGWRWPR